MEDIRNLIKEVLEKGYLMSLATLDDGGLWVCDLIYIYDDDLNIYWISNPNVRHSKAISANNRVAGTITVNLPHDANLGVQFSGTAEEIKEERPDLWEKQLAKRGKGGENIPPGHSWYVLKPANFDLINEKLLGFEKKKLEL